MNDVILQVEDDPNEVLLFQLAIKRAGLAVMQVLNARKFVRNNNFCAQTGRLSEFLPKVAEIEASLQELNAFLQESTNIRQ